MGGIQSSSGYSYTTPPLPTPFTPQIDGEGGRILPRATSRGSVIIALCVNVSSQHTGVFRDIFLILIPTRRRNRDLQPPHRVNDNDSHLGSDLCSHVHGRPITTHTYTPPAGGPAYNT